MPTRNKTNDSYNPLAFLSPLRLIGALIIATIFHPIAVFPEGTPVYSFLKENGRFCVEMFFLISGMLFYLIYYQKLSNKTLSYKEFAKKRFFKLYPIMACSVIYMFCFIYINYAIQGKLVLDVHTDDLIRSLVLGDLAIYGGQSSINGTLWYVAALILCYIIGCCILNVNHENKRNYLFIAPILVGFSLYAMYRSAVIKSPYGARGLITFFLGVYFAIFLKYFSRLDKKKQIIYKIISASIVIGLILLVSLYPSWNKLEKYDRSLIFGNLFFPPLFLLLYDVKPINKFCSLKAFSTVSAISFALYVWDYPIRTTMQNWGQDLGPIYWLILTAIDLSVATTWVLVDKYVRKFINLKMQNHKKLA